MRAGHYVYLLFSFVSTAGLFMFGWELYHTGQGIPVANHVVHTLHQKGFSTFDIDLDPSMNPLVVNVSGKGDSFAFNGPSGKNYTGTFSLNRETAVSHTAVIQKPDAMNNIYASSFLNIETKGRYRYEAHPSNDSKWITNMQIEVVRNARPFNWRTVLKWLGVFFGAWILAELIGDRPPFMQRWEEEARERQIHG